MVKFTAGCVVIALLFYSVSVYAVGAKPKTSEYHIEVCKQQLTDNDCVAAAAKYCATRGYDAATLSDFMLTEGSGSRLFALKLVCGTESKAGTHPAEPAPGVIDL